MKTGKTIVKEFIKNNGLDFSGSGSDLNGNCVILAGYACYLNLTFSKLEKAMDGIELSSEAIDELFRVFQYAVENNYGDFWETPEAKELYKF